MSMTVVDCLEVVEVSHDQRNRVTVPYGQNQLPRQRIFEVATVVQAGQSVANRLLSELLLQGLQFPFRPGTVGNI